MPILNVQPNDPAQAGIVPSQKRIQTNDTPLEVVVPGYLNRVVKQGIAFSEYDMCLVSTKPTESSLTTNTGWYTVSFSDGNWSLVPYGGGSGGSAWVTGGNAGTGGTAILGTLDAEGWAVVVDDVPVIRFDTAPSIYFPELSLTPGGTVNVVADPSNSYKLYFAPGTSSPFSWTIAETSQVIAPGNGYVSADPSAATFTLPTTCDAGQLIGVLANTAGGWTIAQNAGQSCRVGSVSSTVGTGGSVSSTSIGDELTLVCTVANTTFVAISIIGNLTVV